MAAAVATFGLNVAGRRVETGVRLVERLGDMQVASQTACLRRGGDIPIRGRRRRGTVRTWSIRRHRRGGTSLFLHLRHGLAAIVRLWGGTPMVT